MLGSHDWSVWSCGARLVVTDRGCLEAALAVTDRRLVEIGDACDRFRDSELTRVPAATATRISSTLRVLVRAALDTAARTDGLCDPTIGGDLAASGYDRDIRLELDDDRPVRVLVRPRSAWRAVALDGDELTVPDDVVLDLGATAKAVAADLVAAELASALGCGVLLNLGGDIATAGEGPAGGWQVHVQDGDREPATQVALTPGFALATSSTIRRTWRRGGERVHHVIDPRTGRTAARRWRTVSVVAPTALEANGETTAAIVLGDAALDRLAGTGLPARLVAADGTVTTTGGWPPEGRATA